MDLRSSNDGEVRFSAYLEGLTSVIGHADRAKPLRDSIANHVVARLPPSRHPLHCSLRIPDLRARTPPQEIVPPRSSRNLPYAKVISPDNPPLRPESHVPNSIATMRRRLVAALVTTLSRCPCCAARNRHRNL
jgi:hypothetical protein